MFIRSGHSDEGDEVVARYINGLRYAIQDELSIVRIRIVGEAYQLPVKVEDKLSRKNPSAGGKTIIIGRGINISGRGQSSGTKGEEGSNEKDTTQEFRSNESFRGTGNYRGNTNPIVRGFRRSPVIFYKCQTLGHKAYECPESLHTMRRQENRTHAVQVLGNIVGHVVGDNVDVAQPEAGESLMFKRILLKPEKK